MTTTCWRSAATAPSISSSPRKTAAASVAAPPIPADRSADDPESAKPIVVKAGRFGAYVTDGETNATLPRSVTAEAVTLEEAIALLVARRAAGPSKKPARGRKAAAKKAPAKKARGQENGHQEGSGEVGGGGGEESRGQENSQKNFATKKAAAKKVAVKKSASKVAVAKKSA